MLLNKRFDIDTVICPKAFGLMLIRLHEDNFITYLTIIYLKDMSLKYQANNCLKYLRELSANQIAGKQDK